MRKERDSLETKLGQVAGGQWTAEFGALHKWGSLPGGCQIAHMGERGEKDHS